MTALVHVSSKGKQNYTTPAPFIELVQRRWGLEFMVDFAADSVNARCPEFITEEQNSLSINWNDALRAAVHKYGTYEHTPSGWLNPPFKKNPQFGAKAHAETDAGLVLATLTLSSLGTNWFKDNFKNNALNLILEDRMIFEGEKDPYPKELMLSLWGLGLTGLGWYSFKKELEGFKLAA